MATNRRTSRRINGHDSSAAPLLFGHGNTCAQRHAFEWRNA
jgi:hypothetical protein